MPRKTAPPKPVDTKHKVGWSPREFSALTSIGRSTVYELPADLRPESIRIGKRIIIVEAPADYLARIRAMNQNTTEASA